MPLPEHAVHSHSFCLLPKSSFPLSGSKCFCNSYRVMTSACHFPSALLTTCPHFISLITPPDLLLSNHHHHENISSRSPISYSENEFISLWCEVLLGALQKLICQRCCARGSWCFLGMHKIPVLYRLSDHFIDCNQLILGVYQPILFI